MDDRDNEEVGKIAGGGTGAVSGARIGATGVPLPVGGPFAGAALGGGQGRAHGPKGGVSGDFKECRGEPGRRTTPMGTARGMTAQSFQRAKLARLSLPISQTKRVWGNRRRRARSVSTV